MTDPTRRTLIAAGGLAVAAALAGCARIDRTSPEPGGTPDMTPTPSRSAKTLLVFFSRPGENYWEGGRRDLDVGNTKRLARMISDRIDCDIVEIVAADPYPDAYDPTVERNQREQEQDARPGIDGDVPDLSRYDAVLIGSPVWNTRAPMIMRTFLDATNALGGKVVHPFLTYAVGQGSVFADYADLCPDADVREGLAVRGEDVDAAAKSVDAWLRDSGLV